MGIGGFVLFRILDIIKPPPARQVEALPGGWGIVGDDVVAGNLWASAFEIVVGIRTFVALEMPAAKLCLDVYTNVHYTCYTLCGAEDERGLRRDPKPFCKERWRWLNAT